MKNKVFRKLTGLSMALLLILALPVQALADDWYLDMGSITVEAKDGGQTVSQSGGESKQDSSPVIKQNNPSTSTGKTITIKSEGDTTAKVTIDNVNISQGNGINVTDGSKAKVTVKGENTVRATNMDSAPVHVGSGELTITGGEGDKLTAIASTSGAGIGSNYNEAMTGKITIQGDLTVDTSGSYGAGIGSGYGGAITADSSISIQDNAQVTASSKYGAGIGSGSYSNMSGTITIGENAKVKADSSEWGAGIGSGCDGTMSGSISIQDDATVTANSKIGAGIGSGNWADVSGTVSISGNASVTAGSQRGAGIGAGRPNGRNEDGEFREGASIEIKENAEVTINQPEGEKKIGATTTGKSKGEFSIDPTAKLDGQGITDPTVLVNNYGLNAGQIKKPTTPEPTPPEPIPEPIPEPMPEPTPEPTPESTPEPTPPARSLYWVTDGNGQGVAAKEDRQDDTLVVTAELETASFVTTQWGLGELGKQGVKTITFVTSGASSSFDVAEALENLASGNLVLTHTDSNATLTLEGVEHNELLK